MRPAPTRDRVEAALYQHWWTVKYLARVLGMTPAAVNGAIHDLAIFHPVFKKTLRAQRYHPRLYRLYPEAVHVQAVVAFEQGDAA
jgi:hypothetical protein